MGNAREEVLTAVRDGHYATKQLYCDDRLIAWSHRRRFETGLAIARQFEAKRLLDYGCGDGTFLALLAEAGAAPALAVGVELDTEQVDSCRRRFGHLARTRFDLIASLSAPEHERAYDAAVCMEVLEHVVDVDAVVAQLSRVLVDEGTLVVSVPVEVGVPLLVKQTVRRVAAWRRIGDYREGHMTYTWGELLKSVFAGDRPHIERPRHAGTTGVPYHDHKGFNWRVLADRISKGFAITSIVASPFAWLGPSCATQVWFVARKKTV